MTDSSVTGEGAVMPSSVALGARTGGGGTSGQVRDLADVSWPFPRHDLKTVPPYFDAVRTGAKTFEVRRDDRGYQPGDLLVLREWLPTVNAYSPARPLLREVTYVLRGAVELGVVEGFVVLGLAAVDGAS